MSRVGKVTSHRGEVRRWYVEIKDEWDNKAAQELGYVVTGREIRCASESDAQVTNTAINNHANALHNPLGKQPVSHVSGSPRIRP